MRRVLGLIVGLSCLTLAHAAEAPLPYVIAYAETHPLAGAVIVILTEAYRRIGQPVTFKAFPPGRSVELANRGELDAEASRVPDAMDEMTGLIPVPEPIIHRETHAFTTGREIPVEGWESLRPWHLCIMVGDLIAMRRTEGMMREVSHDAAAQFRMLASGRCEVAVSDSATWLVIDRLRLGRFRMMEKPVQSFATYHYLNRRHAELAKPLTRAFRDMHEDGFIETAMAPYLARIREAQTRNSIPP